jgi:hypothetical protein
LLPLSLFGLAALIAFALARSASAGFGVRPDRPVSAAALRAVVDHYRVVTWTYERAARRPLTRTTYSYRRSTDPTYLEWTIATWTQRADTARNAALERINRSVTMRLPEAPTVHSALARRLAYSRRLALDLRGIYPGRTSRRYAVATASNASATLRLWQARSAEAALAVAQHGLVPAFLSSAFSCIHRFEGAWDANTGNGYYGGLQMDVTFQRRYGSAYLSRWGTADNWPAWAQLQAAVRAYRAGRGFAPWPNTARFCGLV